MADIYERQVIEDPLAPRRGAAKQPNSIPLSGVSAPRRSDFSQVGEGQRVIAKLLGESAGLLDKYVENNRSQWELDGKMAYAQGKAEEEIRSTGNKYTMAGFLTMKTETAAQQFYTQELSDIDNKYRQLTPDQYRQELSGRFNEVSKSLGNDEFTQRLLGASAGEVFPKLVAQQTKSNNVWRENETYTSYRDLLVSTATTKDPSAETGGADPNRLRGMLNPELSGLSMERHKAAVTEALGLTLAAGDDRLEKAIIGSDVSRDGINVKDLPPQKALMNQAIDYVLGVEGGFIGNDAGAGPTNMGINSQANPDIDVKNLTADETRILYEERYWNKVVTPDMNADMSIAAFDAAVNQGVSWTKGALKDSGGDLDKFMKLRRERYMDIAKNPEKAKYLPAWLSRLDNLETSAMAGRPMQAKVNDLVDEKKLVLTMAQNGFTEAQIKAAQSSHNSFVTDKDQKFDKQRVLDEQTLVNTALADGNLPQMLEKVGQLQQQRGYSDKWANQIADKVSTQVAEHDKKEKEFTRLDTAGTNGQLSLESAANQRLGIDRERQRIIGKVQDSGNTDAQKNEAIRQEMTDFLVHNGVVDETWEKNIATGLNGDLIQKDGQISKKALSAYQDYLWLKKNAPAGYAANYVKGDAAKLVAQAESLDVAMNSDQALLTAAQMLSQKKDGNEPTRTAAVPEVQKVIDKKIDDELNPGIFSFISKFQAADAFDVKDSDIADAKKSPLLRNYLSSRANTLLAMDATGRLTPDAAVNQAWNDVINRIELAPSGNVLLSGPDKSIREELGFPKAFATNLVFKGLKEFAAYNGKTYFGPRYHGYTEDADNQFAKYKAANPQAGTTGSDERGVFGKTRDFVSGVHPANFVNDPDRRGISWQLLKEDEFGNMIPDGDPKFIPYDVLGDFMRQQQFADRSTRSLTDYVKHGIQDLKQQIVGRD